MIFSVNRVKRFYRTNPSYYRRICSLLSKLFYMIYYGAILFLALFISLVYTFTLKGDSSIYTYFVFGIASFVLIYILFGIIFLRSIKIKGLYIDKGNYSRLWDIVNSLTVDFKGTKIQKIIITDKCMLDIITQRKYGLWGRKNTSLVIGLPIIVGFSEKEIETAIASAVCRNSKKHKRVNKNVRKVYLNLEYIFNDEKKLIRTNRIFDIFMKPIFHKFYKFYKETVFIILRENTIESDYIFLKQYKVEELSNIILKKYVHRYLIENVFIKKVNKALEGEGIPPENIFTLMNEYLNEHIKGRNIIDALKILKAFDRNELSYIGSPLNRVENIGYDVEKFEYEFGDNAARLLGKNFEKIIKKFNLVWYKENKKIWSRLSSEVLKEKEVYEKLCRAFSEFQLLEGDFKLYMELREKFSGANTAIIEGKKICITHPLNAEIRYIVGRMLLVGNNIQGVDYIENAIKLNPFVSIEGYKDIINYYIRKESYKNVSKYKKAYTLLKGECREGLKEREKPKLSRDFYEDIDLSKDELINIKESLKNKKYIKDAYISKIKVRKFKHIPHYILWVNFNMNFFTMEETLRNKDKEIKSDVVINNITVIHLNGDNSYMKIPLKNIKKCKIFSNRKRNFH